MNIEVRYKIRSNPNSMRYLKENSYWYKYLNRNKLYLKDFENEMKEKYKLTVKDRVDKVKDNLDTISKIMDILN